MPAHHIIRRLLECQCHMVVFDMPTFVLGTVLTLVTPMAGNAASSGIGPQNMRATGTCAISVELVLSLYHAIAGALMFLPPRVCQTAVRRTRRVVPDDAESSCRQR